jgi:aldehyde:ferredoxin oxidoreductase
MPQVKRPLALIYAVNPFGPDHQSSEHDESYEPELGYLERLSELGLKDPRPPNSLDTEKVRFAYKTQCFYSLMDSLNVCQFVYGPSWQLYGPSQLVELVKAVTGWDVTLDELMTVGERRVNMMRAFNAREGMGQDDNALPKKLLKPLKGGPTEGVAITQDQFIKAREVYYVIASWDKTKGIPTRKKLEELGLDWILD